MFAAMFLDILVWPEAGTLSFIGAFLFIGALLLTFALFRYAAYKRKRREETIDILMHHAYDRHVAGKEIQRFRVFLNAMEDKHLEDFRQAFSHLRKPLFIYARHHPDKDSVRLYQKLAVDGLGSTMDGLKDVHRGEIGLAEIDSARYIFYVADIGEQLEIALPSSAPRVQGNLLRAYMYRPQSGGYKVMFTIDRKSTNGHYFGQITSIEEAEDRHRMAFMEIDGKIRGFIPETGMEPVGGEESGSQDRLPTNAGPAGSGKETGGEEKREIFECNVYLEKISDRAAVFRADLDIMSYNRYHHLWELRLTLLNGVEFMSRGTFSPLPQGYHRYLFRFLETDPAMIDELKKEIEANQPFPERMN
ncbi:MAG: hypothetical protein KDK33_09565 [Leptospiraceae bacterium]|nr:hypothetical protein [Leptospiraceae bacterium]